MKKKKASVVIKSSKEFTVKYGETFVLPLKSFGFIPEAVMFTRISGSRFVVGAPLTDKEIKKQEKKDDKGV